MFDFSWGEVLLIGAVALIVIGPKDLPAALRTVGRVMGKVKRMASEFQGQFNEALREADLDKVRKDVEGMNRAASAGFNPVKSIRDEMKGAIDKPGAGKAAAGKPGADKPVADKPGAKPAAETVATADAPAETPAPVAPAPPAPAAAPPVAEPAPRDVATDGKQEETRT
jgi:sec-independent protein translocase protein TatB